MHAPRKMLYFASPLFSESEKSLNAQIASALEPWCDVFLPQRDGDLIPQLIAKGCTDVEAYRRVFEKDVAAISNCDGIVINLDGRVIDEGAAFELGYAHALGKHCVGYHTDVRVLIPWGLNPMIKVPLAEVFSSISELALWAKRFAADKTNDDRRYA